MFRSQYTFLCQHYEPYVIETTVGAYVTSGKYFDCGKYVDYNADREVSEAQIVEVVKTGQGLEIEVWDEDFQHAVDGHPEVSLERIRKTLRDPTKVVQSKKSTRACLFYNLEVEADLEFGRIYFCVVVGVLGEGKGKMETAYETAYTKKGNVLFERGQKE